MDRIENHAIDEFLFLSFSFQLVHVSVSIYNADNFDKIPRNL